MFDDFANPTAAEWDAIHAENAAVLARFRNAVEVTTVREPGNVPDELWGRKRREFVDDAREEFEDGLAGACNRR